MPRVHSRKTQKVSKDRIMTNQENSTVSPAQKLRTVPVLLTMPFDDPFDYAVPQGMAVPEIGSFVIVPLGNTRRIGVVWEAGASDPVAPERLKPLAEVLDLPLVPEVSRDFVAWVARYTMAPLGSVLRMVVGSPHNLAPPAMQTVYQLAGPPPERMTSAREKVLDVLAEFPNQSATAIMKQAGVSRGVIRGFVEAGTLQALEMPEADPIDDDFNLELMAAQAPTLSDSQAEAAAALVAAGQSGGYSTTLLEGVTGSGKTEVYFEAIADILAQDETAQVLVLVPEIALTNQLLSRFEARFGLHPRAWHSDLRPKERHDHWQAVAKGKARVIVGARSALMLPYANLRLVVIDEEHDPSYKQEEQVIYHARDMAVVRANLGACPLVLVSATPSLETLVNCQRGRYAHVLLPERHGGAVLPEVTAVDMRQQDMPSTRWVSPALYKALAKTLEEGEQSLLFLNRRGYAPAAICRTCGHRLQREGCSAPLVVHRYGNRLQCHHCDYTIPMPRHCPECEAEDSIVMCGPGVERLAEELAGLFPEARIAIMASDNLRSASESQAFIRRIEEHEIDIVVGTQLVAKGHHFPMLTLVGIVDADLGLSGGDLRAAERTWQQLWQVAGRAGRDERPGRVLLQTYMPEHPVMQALVKGDAEGFYQSEQQEREAQAMPPFGRLAAVILSGRDGSSVDQLARSLAQSIPHQRDIQVLGPAPAPYAVLRGRHRQRFLVKAPLGVNIQQYLRHWLPEAREVKGVRIAIDIDPYSFL